jgi:LuxR family transcriptional regulator, maltose regulon positive regulatory protein
MLGPGGATNRGCIILLRRERLLALVDAPGHLQLWASPGSGKSTLLRQAAGERERAGHRVRLIDGHDADAVIAALADTALDELFLDDADALSGAARDAVAARLESDERPRLVVAGRRDPFPVSPARWLASGELRTAELAFTPDEVAALLELRGLALSPGAVATLAVHTDGWAAGLALACHVLAASADPDAAAASFTGAHVAVGDYLVDAVLGTLPPSERSVVLAAAVAPCVAGDLAAAVTGRDDAAEILDGLARRNLLIERTGDGYAFHPVLFAYLTAEARRSAPEARRAAHLRAVAHVIDADGAAALGHAVAAADAAAVDAVLRRWGVELAMRGDPVLLTALPGIESEAAAVLQRVLLAPDGADAPHSRLRPWDAASAVIVDALAVFAREPASAGAVAGPAAVPSPSSVGRAAHLFARFARACALAGTRSPEAIGAGVTELHRVADLAASLGYRWLQIAAIQSSVTFAIGTPQWRTVETVLRGSLSDDVPVHILATGIGVRMILLQSCLAYVRCEPLPDRWMRPMLSDDFAREHPHAALLARALESIDAMGAYPARDAVERLDRLMAGGPLYDAQFLSFLLVPWLSAATHHGDRPMLEQIAASAQRAFGPDAVETALARFLLHPERGAETDLRRVLGGRGRSWNPVTGAHAWARLAVQSAAHGATAKATHDLTAAVMAADRLDAARVFALFGGDSLSLLRDHAERLGSWSTAAIGLAARATAALGSAGTAQAILLTPRERALLDELPVHQTVADIARRQQLSPNTIKSQLKSVYRKLGVDNRADAIEAGRRAGLLAAGPSTGERPHPARV